MIGNQRTFLRVYICLAVCKSGFMHCRQVIGLDGTFLKGFCKGVLLAAVRIDADNRMFPKAWAICEKEDTTMWTWFLELLRDDLDALDERPFTLMSTSRKASRMPKICYSMVLRHDTVLGIWKATLKLPSPD